MTATIDATCPNCQARPGQPCTAPTNTGRRDVKWFHSARAVASQEVEVTLSETLTEALAGEDDCYLMCSGCDEGATPNSPARVRELLEHCAFSHINSADVLIQRTSELMSAHELRLLMKLPAATEAEEKWRKDRA